VIIPRELEGRPIVYDIADQLNLMLVVVFHSAAKLSLWGNSLTGTIVREIGSLTRLSESTVVWLLS
jgi:hypothetical protein